MKNKKYKALVIIYFCSVVIALCLAEVLVSIIHARNTKAILDKYADGTFLGYSQTRGGGFKNGGYLKANLKEWVWDGYGGKVLWVNNSDGFRSEREFEKYPALGVLRILSIGDSFTGGYRVGQNKTFSDLLERWINRQNKYGKSEVLISCVEEPGDNLYYLDKYGQFYHPHVVLLGVTLGNDIGQSYISLDPKGKYTLTVNDDRITIDKNKNSDVSRLRARLKKHTIPKRCLQEQSKVPTPDKNWFSAINKWLLRHSVIWIILQEKRSFNTTQHIISSCAAYKNPRLYDGVSGLGVLLKAQPSEIETAYKRFFRILRAFKVFCDKRNITFAVALFPQRFQVQEGDWRETIRAFNLNESCFDVMRTNILIREFCREHGIICIDPTEKMAQRYRRNRKSLYFPLGDMHWNELGHKVYFECAREEFEHLIQKALAAGE